MRQYETAFLINPKLEEEEMEKLIQKMAEVVKKNKGRMVNIEKWGKRKLAYPINGLNDAVYVFFHYQGDAAIPLELERRFRQTETVVRYLTLRKEFRAGTKKKGKGTKEEKQKAARKIEEKEKEKIEEREEEEEKAEEREEERAEAKEERMEPAEEEKAPTETEKSGEEN
jgi:small subunit ribosomal protein S6